MYFIVSGTVLVQVAEKDKVTGIAKKQVTASVIQILYILLRRLPVSRIDHLLLDAAVKIRVTFLLKPNHAVIRTTLNLACEQSSFTWIAWG